jgi:hypothetical protein
MSNKPVTLDNLGIGASRTYAENQTRLDPTLLNDLGIPSKAQVPAITALRKAEYETALPEKKGWALFAPPPEALVSARSLFSHGFIPSLGGTEELQALIDRLNAMPNLSAEEKKLISSLELIKDYTRLSEQIQGRLNQYVKG